METMDDIGGKPLVLRDEVEGDRAAIDAVNRAAFGGPDEAELVDALRAAGALVLSLVAVADGELVGHIAFSPVTIAGGGGSTPAIGLAPLAVAPGWQRRGVGTRLIAEGLDRLRAAGHRAVVVLGHPEYYPRLGFSKASGFGLRWGHPAPDEACMALELVPGGLAGVEGVVRFREEFDRFG
jgi:putative acetyltransferase